MIPPIRAATTMITMSAAIPTAVSSAVVWLVATVTPCEQCYNVDNVTVLPTFSQARHCLG
jgi:hypothetical protein